MASTVTGTSLTLNGAHYIVSVLTPANATHAPRFRNTSPDSRTLTQYQSDCQNAATALIDSTVGRGPNSTAAILDMR